MSEVKHTPGPWEWQVHDHSMASLGNGDSPGYGTPLVLSISPCQACSDRAVKGEWKWGRCTTPNEADARLIAAAPDLLARSYAADTCLSVAFSNARDLGREDEARHINKVQQALRAAIAKAEGRA